MLHFYYNAAPNPMKIALLLEELGLPFEAHPVDTRKGEQFAPAFQRINPNAKVPALVDGETVVFDSNAILLYLADKTQQFTPPIADAAQRGSMLSWLMFIASGIGPYSGQAVHFRNMAPEPKEYALNRYDFEAHRHWQIIEDRLSQQHLHVGRELLHCGHGFLGLGALAAHRHRHERRDLGTLPAHKALAGRHQPTPSRCPGREHQNPTRLQNRVG